MSDKRIFELKNMANELYENQINNEGPEKTKYNLKKFTIDSLKQFMPEELLTTESEEKFKSLIEIAKLKLTQFEKKNSNSNNK